MWDARTGQAVGAPLQHQDVVTAVAFSPDGTRVVTASGDKTARVWDARTGQAVGAPLQHQARASSGMTLGGGVESRRDAGGDGVGRQHGAGVGRANGAGGGRAAAASRPLWGRWRGVPDGTRVVTASADKTARVWDARTGQAVGAPLQHQGFVTAVAWSPDGTRVVTASDDKTARVWDARTGQAVGAPLQHQDSVTAVAWSPDGTRVVTASEDKTARVWDARTGQAVGAPLQHQGYCDGGGVECRRDAGGDGVGGQHGAGVGRVGTRSR